MVISIDTSKFSVIPLTRKQKILATSAIVTLTCVGVGFIALVMLKWLLGAIGIASNMFMLWNRRPWQTPIWGMRFTKNLVCWLAGFSGIIAIITILAKL